MKIKESIVLKSKVESTASAKVKVTLSMDDDKSTLKEHLDEEVGGNTETERTEVFCRITRAITNNGRKLVKYRTGKRQTTHLISREDAWLRKLD